MVPVCLSVFLAVCLTVTYFFQLQHWYEEAATCNNIVRTQHASNVFGAVNWVWGAMSIAAAGVRFSVPRMTISDRIVVVPGLDQ